MLCYLLVSLLFVHQFRNIIKFYLLHLKLSWLLLVLDKILLVLYFNICIKYVFYLFYCEVDLAHEGLSVVG